MPKMKFWYREPGLWVPLSCAIASVGTSGANFADPSPWNRTVDVGAGSDRVIFACYWLGNTPTPITSVTYAGDALTLGPTRIMSGVWTLAIYYKFGCASGSNTLATNYAGTPNQASSVAWYTGASAIDSSNNSTANTGTMTCTLTMTADQCWMLLYAASENAFTLTASTGATLIESHDTWRRLFDSGAALSTGSNSMTYTATSDPKSNVFLGFSPASSGPTVAQEFPAFVEQLSGQMVGLRYM